MLEKDMLELKAKIDKRIEDTLADLKELLTTDPYADDPTAWENATTAMAALKTAHMWINRTLYEGKENK